MIEGFGIRLRDIREGKCWSQAYLAEKVGTQQQNVYKWEKEKDIPSTRYLIKICIALGVSSDELLGLKVVAR
jgi:transcriptional regulator with XRE-family HTH domain